MIKSGKNKQIAVIISAVSRFEDKLKKLILLLNMCKNFCTLTVTYNDEKLIGGMLKGIEDLYNLVIISKPWKGVHTRFDSTGDIAKRMGANVIYKDFDWENRNIKAVSRETEQRNFGLEYLYNKNFEYILILDSDEYFTKKDINKIIEYVLKNEADSYIPGNAKVYWRSWKHHYQYKGGTTCIKANIKIDRKRDLDEKTKKVMMLPNDIVLHHFSYSGTKEEMKRKAETRPYMILNYKWIDNYWSNWKFGDNSFQKIIETKDIPEEILGRYIKSINLLY